MKLNDNAVGIIIKGSDFEYVKAVRKPNTDCKISQEIWFKEKQSIFKRKRKEWWKMILKDNEVQFEKGEPVVEGCWECNSANENLKEAKVMHVCPHCKKFFCYGRFLSEFGTDKELIEWLTKKKEDELTK